MRLKKIIISVVLSFACSNVQAQVRCSSDTVSLYLTFDDGPVKATPFLFSFVCKDSIPVNVFVVGQHVYSLAEGLDIIRKYRANNNIEIDNHSYNHARKKYKEFYSHPDNVVADILLNEDTLDLKNKILRLPGRNVWRLNGKSRNDLIDAKPAADSLSKLGFKIFGWDIEWMYDSARQSFYSAERMINIIKNLLQNNRTFSPGQVVILCHDSMLDDESAREQLILFSLKSKENKSWRFNHLRFYPAECFALPDDFVHLEQ